MLFHEIRRRPPLFCVVAIALAGCEPSPQTGGQPTSSATSSSTPRVADYTPPPRCQRQGTRVVGYTDRQERVSVCRRDESDGNIAVVLREISRPLDSTSLSDEVGLPTAQNSPRSMLIPQLQDSLKQSFAFLETGIPVRNKRVQVLEGNGGVPGADACLRFSYESWRRDRSDGKSLWEGLNCARMNIEDRAIDEAYIAVGGDRPKSSPDPDWFSAAIQSTPGSLRFR